MPLDHARPYVFDARSAAWDRITGWERYTREIAVRLRQADPLVRTRCVGSSRLTSRLWQDAVATPLAISRARVVHFPTIPPLPWATAQARLIFTVHDLTWWRFPETASRMGRLYYGPLAKRALSRCHIVTDTRTVAEELVGDFGLSRDQVSVVPLGASLPSPGNQPTGQRPYLLAVGTQEPRKNLQLLVDAYTRSGVARTHDLVVVGRIGWGRSLEGVRVLSGLDDVALATTYAGASALVMPSIYEGFGLPVVEAMRLGVPVVCSDIPVLREVSGGHARFFDPCDVHSLVDALREARSIEAPPAAAEWARTTWRWDRAAEALSALYRQLDD